MALLIEVELKTPEAVCGESAFFTVRLRNTGLPIEVCELDADNGKLQLVHTRPDGTESTADGNGWLKRDGVFRHGAEEPTRTTLGDGDVIEERGDLLRWCGELESGEHRFVARIIDLLDPVESEPVTLTVTPAQPLRHVACVPGYQTPTAPLSAAWVHADDRTQQVFYSQPSSRLPQNLWRGLRVAAAKDVRDLAVANVPTARVLRGHVAWLDKSQLRVASVPLDGSKPATVFDIKAPFGGALLPAGLSMPDGSAYFVMLDNKRRAIAVGRVGPDGAIRWREQVLAADSGVGPSFCCWEGTRRLHFFWSRPGGREVRRTVFFLDDLDGEVPTVIDFINDHKVIGLHATFDAKSALLEAPGFEHNQPREKSAEEPPGPKRVLWILSDDGKFVVATRLIQGAPRVAARLRFGDVERKVVSTALDSQGHLAVLARDASGRGWFAHTLRGEVHAVSELIGRSLEPASEPQLLAARMPGGLPWVFVRWVDSSAGAVHCQKLSPVEEVVPDHQNESQHSGHGHDH